MSDRPAKGVTATASEWFRHDVQERLENKVGGPARLKVILLLAGVLGLSSADTSTVGAIATPLEHALVITNTELGLLVAVSTGIGAIATLPFGVLVDRFRRTKILYRSIALWCAAMLASAFTNSFATLLMTRLALGIVVAAAAPAVASLVGDLFPVSERARIYGYILTGELVGAGAGFLGSGDLAGLLSWRASFAWLAIPGALLAFSIRRFLPEPARGGRSRIVPGAEEIPAAESPAGSPTTENDATDGNVAAGNVADGTGGAGRSGGERITGDAAEDSRPGGNEGPGAGVVAREVRRQGVRPERDRVLREDPRTISARAAARYVLSIPTNRWLILSSGLGYFFLTGLETFGVEYLRAQYGLAQASASELLVVIGAGAVIGALAGGRIADRRVEHGEVAARVWVTSLAFLLASGCFVAGLLVSSLGLALALLFLGAAGIGASNPPLDAARLDIVQSALWGRAEAVRGVLRSLLIAIAPVVFGAVSDQLSGASGAQGHSASGAGLGETFLVMAATLLTAGVVLLVARRSYPSDVATAIASERVARARPQESQTEHR